MIAAWILLYFCCHGIAHWAVGRLLGIRFAFYLVGGTGNPTGYPPGLRWLFEHLPFFGVQTEKSSMQKAAPIRKAIMWSAGITASAVVPTLGALYAWSARVPGSRPSRCCGPSERSPATGEAGPATTRRRDAPARFVRLPPFLLPSRGTTGKRTENQEPEV